MARCTTVGFWPGNLEHPEWNSTNPIWFGFDCLFTIAHIDLLFACQAQRRTIPKLRATPPGICSRLGVFATAVSRLHYFLEKRRPRHPHPERCQGGVREAEIACRSCSVFSDRLLRCRRSITDEAVREAEKAGQLDP